MNEKLGPVYNTLLSCLQFYRCPQDRGHQEHVESNMAAFQSKSASLVWWGSQQVNQQ